MWEVRRHIQQTGGRGVCVCMCVCMRVCVCVHVWRGRYIVSLNKGKQREKPGQTADK